ncbi:hypothetical protein [Cytophaga aurantiaca]|uniref:hypothetical protein n=1 Tax=Cytophaga aurantiaca TaxID=29530 RepID=UPI00037A620B|nr:hypothetical protein [Cytophaga aurantiaca]
MIVIDLFITEKCIRDSVGPNYDLDDAKVEDWIYTIISTIVAHGAKKEYSILIHVPKSLTTLDAANISAKLNEFYLIHTTELKNELMVMKTQSLDALSKGVPIMIAALSLNFVIEDRLKGYDEIRYFDFIIKNPCTFLDG